MRMLLRRTLVRRVVLTLLLLGPVTIWVTLMSFRYVQLWTQQRQLRAHFETSQVAIGIRDALGSIEDPEQARVVAEAIDRMNTASRQRAKITTIVVIQLLDRRTRRLIFSSPDAGSEILRDGQRYEVFAFDTDHWSVLWGRTPIDWWWVFKALQGDLFFNMALAFPGLLLLAWLAVSRGLKPLRRLSAAIASRGPDDMTALRSESVYAELQPLEQALDSLLSKLRHKIETERAFVASAAHELRTPLAVITAQAHVLAKAASSQDRADAALRLESATDRASHLIHQLLVLARMDMERPLQPDKVDLARAARYAIADLYPQAVNRNMEIALEAPDTLVLSLEAHVLQSILENLIDNAIRYGRDGGRILLSLQTSGTDTVSLSVADDGPGIAESDRSRIFERFQRGTSIESGARGTGLGLTIVKQGALRMGAEVRLTDGLDGRGCCFTVVIPARAF